MGSVPFFDPDPFFDRDRHGGEAMRAILIGALSLTLCCLAASGCADRRRSPPKTIVFGPPQGGDAPQVFGSRAKAVMSAVEKAGAAAQVRLAQEEQRMVEQPQVVHQDEPPA